MTDESVGGTKCRPLVFPRQILSARRAQARLAVGQNEVRAEDFLGSNLFRKKVAIQCNFFHISCDFYPLFDLTRYLFGKNWAKKTVAISIDSFEYEHPVLLAEDILEKISEIVFPIKAENKGVVVVAVDTYKPVFSFIIFAPNKSGALEIYKKLTRIWKRDNLNIQ